jgi:hypothetical protein
MRATPSGSPENPPGLPHPDAECDASEDEPNQDVDMDKQHHGYHAEYRENEELEKHHPDPRSGFDCGGAEKVPRRPFIRGIFIADSTGELLIVDLPLQGYTTPTIDA